MKIKFSFLAPLAAAFLFAAASVPAAAQGKPDAKNTLYLQLKGGRVTIQLLPNLAPRHVAQIKKLVAQKFYDGIVFHRVIDGFMAQTGDPTGTGTGGSKLPDLPAELSGYRYKRGTVGMARAQDPNSANSQWFICFTNTGCSFLTGKYTVWGQVTAGMGAVDRIKRGAPGSGTVSGPDKIISLRLAK